jgi:prefoldin subunit 5
MMTPSNLAPSIMSDLVDEAKKMMQERLTGELSSDKKTTKITDIDPSYGMKDSKAEAIDRIEECLNEIKEMKKDIKEILALLKDHVKS